mmetsp:Transcript_69040/g.108978  ORF Transcript_69040/g.108978 Transcript_69040/m.108978 type:complete len:182 (+) Transcript_69040:3-548(+)
MIIEWDDGDDTNNKVSYDKVRRTATGKTCDGPPKAGGKVPRQSSPPKEDKKAPAASPESDKWVPPEIPCTILPRLHWEGSDPKWNKRAIEYLRKEYEPDEVIDGFDWHVILRFNDVNRCEETYNLLDSKLKECKESDIEKCHTHEFVKAIEYVGDDPEQRRRTGRHIHDPSKHPQAVRQEL